jgi:hypothetical protein
MKENHEQGARAWRRSHFLGGGLDACLSAETHRKVVLG